MEITDAWWREHDDRNILPLYTRPCGTNNHPPKWRPVTPFKKLLLLSKPQRRFGRDLVEISPFRRRFDKRTDTKCDTRTDSGPLFRRDTEPPPQTRIRQLIEAVALRTP